MFRISQQGVLACERVQGPSPTPKEAGLWEARLRALRPGIEKQAANALTHLAVVQEANRANEVALLLGGIGDRHEATEAYQAAAAGVIGIQIGKLSIEEGITAAHDLSIPRPPQELRPAVPAELVFAQAS